MSTNPQQPEMVTLTVDGKSVTVPKGTNLIEAAKAAGVEVPFYCYHPHLSIAGNCRMCQVEVKGRAKLEIGCNTGALNGMEVFTQKTSKRVEDAQAATLEFILINHPLDCTVCDQAGHCKLQDFHYDYNARPSRFLEDKEHKVKATPLGPTVMLDGERCIMCTRCIRFCDEVTETSELGMLNRGDRSVISINPGKELNNPLSGTVVDLCPVGALTHKEWRFNTRIWFTNETDSICPGCSTGCNVRVAERDGQVVQVKARLNEKVNKEWLCDEGRYGFHRFLPETRLTTARVSGNEMNLAEALKRTKGLASAQALVLLSPDLLLEEYDLIKKFVAKHMSQATVAINYRERSLTKTEAILISPDYAANFRGAEYSGVVQGDLQAGYLQALDRVRRGEITSLVVIGDRAIEVGDLATLTEAIAKIPVSVGLLSNAASSLVPVLKVALPSRSILEKSGLLVNRNQRLQYSDKVIEIKAGTEPEWRLLNQIAGINGARLTNAISDRDLTLEYLGQESRVKGLKISSIKAGGICLKSYQPSTNSDAATNGQAGADRAGV